MPYDIRGQYIWLSSSSPFNYMVIEGVLSSTLLMDELIEKISLKYSQVGYPSEFVAFKISENNKSIFCIKQNFEIAFIEMIEEKFENDNLLSDCAQNIFDDIIRNIKMIELYIQKIDSSSKIIGRSITTQKSLYQ